jgi:hypothetical protein
LCYNIFVGGDMAYVPEMNYSPEENYTAEMGGLFKSLKKIAKSIAPNIISAVPLPQTQALNALSKIKIKTGKKSSPQEVSPQPTIEPTETSGDNKIFGLDKKIIFISGGAVGLILLLTLMKKK